MKLVLLFLFLLLVNLSYSQQACADESDCTDGPDDPICQSPTAQCLENICVYEPIPNCCNVNDDCSTLTIGPCVKSYYCNGENQCEPDMKECENGEPCTDYCVNLEEECSNRTCIASDDPEIDSTCQVTFEFECEKPANKCIESYCAYGLGCTEYDPLCTDYVPCTLDVCASADTGCTHTPIENCIDCDGSACITEDACLPSLCVPYEYVRGGGPTHECKIIPVNCTTNDPCLINGICVQGECEYENICSSEETTAVTTTSATTTATTTSATITSATTSQVTTIATTASTVATTTASITTGSVTLSSSTLGSSESDEYEGPKYPNCLDCKDLNCEKMGRRCKYLKSYNKDCYEDGHQEKKFKHKHPHHNNPHGNSHHQNPHGNAHHQNPHGNAHHQNPHGNAHHQNPHGNVHHESIGHFNHHNNPHQNNNGGYGHHSSKYINYNDNNNGGGGRNYERDRQDDYNGNDNDEEFLIFNNIRYPRRLGPFDCCPYTPTCY